VADTPDISPVKLVSFKSKEQVKQENKTAVDAMFVQRVTEAINGGFEGAALVLENTDGNLMVIYATPGRAALIAMLEAAKLHSLLGNASG
jgi:hypothetical protein